MLKTFESFDEGFMIYLQGGFPLQLVDTQEVDRAMKSMALLTAKWNKELPKTQADEHIKQSGFRFSKWDVSNGWLDEEGKELQEGSKEPIECLKYILTEKAKAGVYVIQNYHFFWDDIMMKPMIVELLREIYAVGKVSYKYVIFLGSKDKLPLEVQKYMVYLDFLLPSVDELKETISTYAKHWNVKLSSHELTDAALAASGLTTQEVEGATCIAIVKSKGKTIDKDIIFAEKAQAVKRSGMLEVMMTPDTIDTVGGLVVMKNEFRKTAVAFQERERAIEYKLPTPNGCLIAGISGTGKSLSAKAIAHLFRVPLYRWDIGKVFGGIIGDTERNTRETFRLIEAVSPCVILIDEIEKGLSGLSSSDQSDAGVTARFIGSFLTFLEEKDFPAYIVATANDVTKLPTEILRKGRFDEIWWVAMPNKDEREEIFTIHLEKTGRPLKNFQKRMSSFITLSDGLVGAEIEAVIQKAMFRAFSDKFREFTADDILFEMDQMVALGNTKKEDIARLEAWAKGRARNANLPGKHEFVSLDDKKGGRKVVLSK